MTLFQAKRRAYRLRVQAWHVVSFLGLFWHNLRAVIIWFYRHLREESNLCYSLLWQFLVQYTSPFRCQPWAVISSAFDNFSGLLIPCPASILGQKSRAGERLNLWPFMLYPNREFKNSSFPPRSHKPLRHRCAQTQTTGEGIAKIKERGTGWAFLADP